MKRFLFFLSCAFSLQATLFFTDQMIQSHLTSYSKEELSLIEKDLKVVRSVCLDGSENAESRFYLATAGGPGARKTTILERFVSTHPEYQKGVYLDPDPRTLKYMVHTYYAESLSPLMIAQGADYGKTLQNAYEKWRYASNYIVLNLLEEAFSAGRSIVYGTTSTGGHIPSFFAKLKENGYEIVLLLCSCPDEIRRKAIEYRNTKICFYQSSPEDAVAKGKFFAQRMPDYFATANLIYIYWSDDLFSPERLAGVWRQGKLEVLDEEALKRFIQKYEDDRLSFQKEARPMPPHFETFIRN